MKVINKKQEFTNQNTLKSFWGIRNVNPKQIQTNRIIQMGFENTTLKKMVINQINETEESLFVASFLLSDDQIIDSITDANERGVRVYILTSNEALLDRERRDDPTEFDKEVLDHHKKVLKILSVNSLVRASPHLHAKFIISDPLSNPHGILLTSNITKEALTRNPELGVILYPAEVLELFEAFRITFWEGSGHELKEKKWATVSSKSTPPTSNWKSILTTIKGKNNIEDRLIQIISNSKGILFLGSYKIDVNTRIIELILEYSEKHKVIIFTRLHKHNQDLYHKVLGNHNITLVASKFFHAKFIFNNDEGVVMTSNINNQGFSDGFEVGIHLKNISEHLEILNNWKSNLELIHYHEKMIVDINCDSIIKYSDKSKKFEYFKIEEKEEISKEINTESIIEYINWVDGEIPKPDLNYQKKVISKYTINPPLLPVKSIKINNLDEIKNSRVIDIVRDICDKNGTPKYQIYLNKTEIYVKVDSLKEYNKIKEKIPSSIIIVF